jgi:hypothetical protein
MFVVAVVVVVVVVVVLVRRFGRIVFCLENNKTKTKA